MTSAILRLREGTIAWAEAEEQAVLLDLDGARYLGLNHSGAVLWTMLAAGTTRAELVARLATDFAVPTERARADVDAFLKQCAQRGYLDS